MSINFIFYLTQATSSYPFCPAVFRLRPGWVQAQKRPLMERAMVNKKAKAKKPKQSNQSKQSGPKGGGASFGDLGSSQSNAKSKKRK